MIIGPVSGFHAVGFGVVDHLLDALCSPDFSKLWDLLVMRWLVELMWISGSLKSRPESCSRYVADTSAISQLMCKKMLSDLGTVVWIDPCNWYDGRALTNKVRCSLVCF